MRNFWLGLCGALLFTSAAWGQTMPKIYAYFGGYTGAKTGGKGIMVSEFDTATGKLTEPKLAVETGSPSFLAIHPNSKVLYSVGEGGGAEGGAVTAFDINADGSLTKKNNLFSGGAGPCHITIDAAGKFAAVANYGGGSTAIYSLKDDGSFKERTDFIQHGAGSNVNKARQAGPHAHCCSFNELGTFLLTADLGLDKVLVRQVNRDTGKLTEAGSIDLPPGSGPRHFHLAPGDKVAYICGELDSTVNVATIDFETKSFKITQSLTTLPAPTPGNSTAECRIHPNGKFVYVSNRGHNSIAAFKIDGGKVTTLGQTKGEFKVPRNFNIDPTGKWMLVAGQNSNNVEVFSIGDDGTLKSTGTVVSTPAPVCIKFVTR